MNHTGLVATSDWEKKLAAHYREQAIIELKAATTSSWTTDVEKRISSYLEAELTQQAGKVDEAKALFRKVISHEKTLPPNEDFAWIASWSGDQLALIDKPQPTLQPDSQVALPPLPTPGNDAPPTVAETGSPAPKPMGKEEALNEIKTARFLNRDDILDSQDPEIIKALDERIQRLRQTKATGGWDWARQHEIRSFEAVTRGKKLLQVPVR